MSKRGLKSDDEEGFIRAFNDETADTCEMYQVRVEWHLCKGRFSSDLVLRGYAHRIDADGSEQVYVSIDYPYPTHKANRLHAGLYAAAIRLNVAVQSKWRDEHGHYMSAADEPTGE